MFITAHAQKKVDYKVGRLLKVSDQSFISPDGNNKIAYLIHLKEHENDYFGLYNVHILLGHDQSKLLKPDSEVQFRVSGKDLFIKTEENKELKARLCEKVMVFGSPAVKCGGLTIMGKESE